MEVLKLQLLMMLFAFAACDPLAVPSRSAQDMANPRTDPGTCGNKEYISNICNPDLVIVYREVLQLDEFIAEKFNNTFCTCTDRKACVVPQDTGNNIIGVAIIKSIKLDPSVRPAGDANVDESIHLMTATLAAAKKFAYTLLQEWKWGMCGLQVVIFYSQNDNVIYTVTSDKAQPVLTDALISDITMKYRTFFGVGKDVTKGLENMLLDYKSVFDGTYVPVVSWDASRPEAVMSTNTASTSATCTYLLLTSTILVILSPVFRFCFGVGH